MIPMYTKECECVDMKEVLGEVKNKLKLALLNQELEINGVPTAVSTSSTGNGGLRYWFTCPECGQRCGKLFRVSQRLACRKCLELKYQSP